MRIVWTVLIAAMLAVIVFLPKDFTFSELPKLVAQGNQAPIAGGT